KVALGRPSIFHLRSKRSAGKIKTNNKNKAAFAYRKRRLILLPKNSPEISNKACVIINFFDI
ncbi:MAG: hypothetical protein K2O44_02125, partial [Clostridia bacterium]|nr:hypothetical protein [Clostridia bacterium]